MKAKDLKNTLLQLAVQGKLVPQDPTGEPASELLERIRAEKSRLIKEGKIKKEKPLPPITEDEIPFEIPENWVWVRLGEIASIYNGNSINAEEKQQKYSKEYNGYPYIATKDVAFDSQIDYTNGIYIPHEEKNFKIAFSGSILLCMEGGSAGKKIGMLNQTVCFGNKLCCFRTITFYNKYLYYYLQSHTFFSFFSALMTGIIGGVGAQKLKSIPLPLPPLSEQARIVSKIEELLPYVEEYGAAEERLSVLNRDFPSALRKSILQEAVQGKLVPQDPADEPASELLKRIQNEKAKLIKEGKIKKEKPLPPITEDEIPFEIPENWVWVRLGEILNTLPRNGFSPKPVNFATDIKTLTLSATTTGVFNPLAFKYIDVPITKDSYLWLNDGDILIQRSNSLEYVGTSCIFRGKSYVYIYPDLMMKIQLPVTVNNLYIDYYLKSHTVRKYMQKSAAGSAKSMPKINQKTVTHCLIPLPPLSEQARIVSKIEELFSLCGEIDR